MGADVNFKLGKDDFHWTPVAKAAMRGHPQVLRLLIENKADINVFNQFGSSPLHMAVFYNHEECVSILLKSKALLNEKNDFGMTPLMLAATRCPAICRMLLESGADMSVKNNSGKTAFDLCNECL